MFRSGFEPLTQGFSVLCSNQLELPKRLLLFFIFTYFYKKYIYMESKTLPSLLHTNKTHVGAVEMSPWMYPYMLGYRDKVPFLMLRKL